MMATDPRTAPWAAASPLIDDAGKTGHTLSTDGWSAGVPRYYVVYIRRNPHRHEKRLSGDVRVTDRHIVSAYTAADAITQTLLGYASTLAPRVSSVHPVNELGDCPPDDGWVE